MILAAFNGRTIRSGKGAPFREAKMLDISGRVLSWEALGIAIAFLSLLLGALSLASSARTARLQHMHDLFRDYLRLQLEYGDDAGRRSAGRRDNLAGFKMYVLEEMILWIKREERWGFTRLWSDAHEDHIRSWTATVDWHLDHSSSADMAEFEAAKDCYGPDMRAAVRNSVRRAPLASRVEHGPEPSTPG